MKYIGFYKDQLKLKAETKNGEKDYNVTQEVKDDMKANWTAGDLFDVKEVGWAKPNGVTTITKVVKFAKTRPEAANSPANSSRPTAPYTDKNVSIVRQVIFKVAGRVTCGQNGSLDEFDSAYLRLKSKYQDELLALIDLNATSKALEKKVEAPVKETVKVEAAMELEEDKVTEQPME